MSLAWSRKNGLATLWSKSGEVSARQQPPEQAPFRDAGRLSRRRDDRRVAGEHDVGHAGVGALVQLREDLGAGEHLVEGHGRVLDPGREAADDRGGPGDGGEVVQTEAQRQRRPVDDPGPGRPAVRRAEHDETAGDPVAPLALDEPARDQAPHRVGRDVERLAVPRPQADRLQPRLEQRGRCPRSWCSGSRSRRSAPGRTGWRAAGRRRAWRAGRSGPCSGCRR